ncbi:MAG: galactokinase [Bacteroidales bacterium]|nr:galactokinase [Bacteroidales bacterium]
METQKIAEKFRTLFGTDGILYASAGRINLIGEHTDYNGGYVFPGAIDKVVAAAIKPNGTNKVRAYSFDNQEMAEFGLNEEDKPERHWACYVFGVCREIQKRGGKVEGFDTVFSGDIPIGAGLSSSAALESTFAFALNDLFNDNAIDKFELAKIGQSTEHNYCGVNCGIMDQFASCFGKAGSLIRLNCKTLEYQYFPFDPKGYKLVLLDTCVKHSLASSAYNFRRQSCERAAAAIKKNHPEVDFLSDCKRVWLDEVRSEISEEDFIRSEYVIGEVQRVLDVCDALERSDYETVGELMYQTHFGLSRLYEVSCEELDFLNKLARKHEVTGSRVMGGGFGGCTINLVKEELYDEFVSDAKKQFAAKYGHEPKVYDVVISDGARRL